MPASFDLYREIILDHFKSPRNKITLAEADIRAQGANPLCGDEMELSLKLDDGKISGVGIITKGCSISVAAASMMGEAIKGKTPEEARILVDKFKRNMLEKGEAHWDDELEEMECLEGVKKYPVRVKCALLSWNTLLQGFKDEDGVYTDEKSSEEHNRQQATGNRGEK